MLDSWGSLSFNDYSVCTYWYVEGDNYYLLEVWRGRWDYPSLRKKVIELMRHTGARKVIIEDQGSGIQLIQDLRQANLGTSIIAYKPETDKVTRMSVQSAVIEAERVWLPRKAPWLEDFKAEMLAFPGGRFDDQVDSVSQFLDWQSRRSRFRGSSDRLFGW